MHKIGPCKFIPAVSHAIIIKQRNRNLCDTGSVRKSRKINGFTTTFRLHTKVTIPLLNLVSLANHDMRKTWCYVCGVYGGMFRKTNGDLDSLRFSYITES